jgi:hypothetical protein
MIVCRVINKFKGTRTAQIATQWVWEKSSKPAKSGIGSFELWDLLRQTLSIDRHLAV